jgi:hypothetical protein
MANSKLLKEAIADAKAVKETALANAKLALEEAFTPRLQSMLTQKLKAEAEGDDDESIEEELDSSEIGASTAQPDTKAHTDGDFEEETGEPGSELDDYDEVDINENEDEESIDEEDELETDDKEAEISELRKRLAELEGEDEIPNDDELSTENEEEDADLDAIIKELEDQLDDEESIEEDEEVEDEPVVERRKKKMKETLANGEEAGTDKGADPKLVVTNEENDDEIDLDEILREMEAELDDEPEPETSDDANDTIEKLEKELNETYKTIKSLRRTINEVNLLNAKLLFANKLFRNHNMNNEQKVKVIETLDRTKDVREAKLVYATLAETLKYSVSNKSLKKSITEGSASRTVKSTKPSSGKQIVTESTELSNRFQKLAGIIK